MVDNEQSEANEEIIEHTDESQVPIRIPFDPNLIRIRRDPFTLGQLIDKIEYKEVNFFTLFQRKSDLWDKVKQSRLIESVLLRLPLPSFYFDELTEQTEDGTVYPWQVIDGLQRCSVFKNFVVDKTMVLEDLEFLTQFNGKSYNELPKELRRRIEQTPITVYVVELGTPDEVKFNIFKRINTGGLILMPQEIRHALNQGEPAFFVEELANHQSFKRATNYRIATDRMEDRDFVTRFASFYLVEYSNYEPDLDTFMTKGMGRIKDITPENRQVMKENFYASMNTAYSIFGDDAFRKRANPSDRRRPINKALFETLSVNLAQLTVEQRDKLINNSDLFRQKFMDLNQEPKFYSSISSGTGQKENVRTRFVEIKRIIDETLQLAND
jgi:hypothetical protein